jgi:uracil phosphoribosyltransferase
MYRSPTSRLPIQYYNRLPKSHASDVAFILDPCVATSDTLQAVCSIIEKWGAKRVVVICVLGARSGLDKLLARHPDLEVYIAAVDETLSEDGMILPGFGDAGDRLFCTPFDQHNLSASMSADNLDCLSIAASTEGNGNDLKRSRPDKEGY